MGSRHLAGISQLDTSMAPKREPRQPSHMAQLTGFALAAAVLLAGCGAVHPTIDGLRAIPGANVQYPGSIAYGINQVPDENTVWNQSSAQLIQYRCSHADEQQTVTWFQQHLANAGWTAQPNPLHRIADPTITATYEWTRGQRQIDLYLVTQARTDSWARQAGRPIGCHVGYKSVTQ